MLTSYMTWLKLHSESHFNTFFEGLKEYLRSKLLLIKIEGVHPYYSCGADYHHRSVLNWKPFKHFENYCQVRGYDDIAVKELIEEKLQRKINCECELVNDCESDRRDRLRRSFGIDLGGPGGEDV